MEMEQNEPVVLQEHSLHFLEMAFRTDKRQIMENPDGYGRQTAVCGDSVEIFLSVRNNQIHSISYNSNGCMNTNACANAVVFLAEGKSVDRAWEIRPETVTDYLKSLPPHETHCAEMAVDALRLAISDYRELVGKPWKRAYRKK